MLPIQLNQALQDDLESLKKLNLGIIPAKIFYRDLCLGWLLVYLLFAGTQLMACFFATQINAWENKRLENHIASMRVFEKGSDFFKFSAPFNEERELEKKYPQATPEEINTMIIKNKKAREDARFKKNEEREAEYKKMRKNEHVVQVAKMFLGVIFSSLFFTLFFIGKVKSYVIFKQQLQSRLKTGDYISRKIKIAFFGFFTVFGLLSLVSIPLFDQDMTFFAAIPCLIFSAIVVGLFIDMEASRIGVSVLSTAITKFFKSSQGNKTITS